MDWKQKIDLRTVGVFTVFTLIVAVCLALDSEAFAYQQLTKDAYDFEVIENALIQAHINNESYDLMDTQTSDETGFSTSELGEGNYTIRTSRAGHNENERIIYINDSEERITYLTYVSESIIKLVYTDMTLTGDHEVCLFYNNNNRLKDCYTSNETLLLTANNYTMYVKQNLIDSAGASSNMLTIIKQLLPFLIIVLVIGGLLIFGLTAVYLITRRVIK